VSTDPTHTLSIESVGLTPSGDAAPALALVLRADRPLEPSSIHGLAGIDEVLFSRGLKRSARREGRRLYLEVDDARMSRDHARLHILRDRCVIEDGSSKNGTWVNGHRVERAELASRSVLELGQTFFAFRACLPSCEAADIVATDDTRTLVPGFAATLDSAERVAESSISVMILGPSGTGKEVLSRAIHVRSRRPGQFIPVNCGALPSELIEAELFGVKKGAFSGAASDRIGLVRAAHGGTLLLDEIGDLPLVSQTKLLRVLQEREVTAVGDTKAVPVDFRVLSATHRDLQELVRQQRFRADLLARLNGVTLRLPSLTDRREDMGILVRALLMRHAGDASRITFTGRAARALLLYGWPLNVRELEKALEAAIVLSDGAPIDVPHLQSSLQPRVDRSTSTTGANTQGGQHRDAGRSSDEQLLAELRAALTEHHGNVSAVARTMGKARMQIHRWLKRFDLDPASFRPPETRSGEEISREHPH
jgi:transcriptional regulator of acetoin/glycerol metabolism